MLFIAVLISLFSFGHVPDAVQTSAATSPTVSVTAPVGAISPSTARAVQTPAAPTDRAPSAGVPILMYHVLGTAPKGAPYPQLYVSAQHFQQQMTWLSDHGYQAVTLQRLYDSFHGHAALPAHPVVISFDDGLRSQADVAQPVLSTHGWPAVLNLVVHHYTQTPPAITAARVKRLIAAGWEIDSHTVNHLSLPTLDDAQLRREVADSRRILQNDFGVPVNFFCYPSGRYNTHVIDAVRAAGYLAATTTNEGFTRAGQPTFELSRVRIDHDTDISAFAAKVRRG